MDIPAALLYTILSTVAEMAMEPGPDPQILNEPAGLARKLPDAARKGVMQPPRGDGFLIIDDQQWPLAPTAQIRSRQNLIVMPMSVHRPVEVVYIPNSSGAIHRVWMLTPSESAAPRAR